MTALPSFMYRDPALVLEGREKCDGCEHLATWSIAERVIEICDRGARVRRKPMYRCDAWKHKDQEGNRDDRNDR